MIKVGVDVNCEEKYYIFFIIVFKEGYCDIVYELIVVGVDIN